MKFRGKKWARLFPDGSIKPVSYVKLFLLQRTSWLDLPLLFLYPVMHALERIGWQIEALPLLMCIKSFPMDLRPFQPELPQRSQQECHILLLVVCIAQRW